MMTSSRNYLFLTFIFFCILLQQSVVNCNASLKKCVEPKFNANQIITVDYFYGFITDDTKDGQTAGANLCNIVTESNGLISMAYRPGADAELDSSGKMICSSQVKCIKNRRISCSYKTNADIFNDCTAMLPAINGKVADCVCEASADDILIANRNDYVKTKATVVPALVVNQVFDACFTDYTYKSMVKYFCTAYNNALPFCK